jgi:Protein of unknown function (DUF3131)
MSWAKTAWSYFAPGVGVNSNTGLHMANLEFPCFTDWDLASYIMSIIYAYRLGLIVTNGAWSFNDRIQKVLTFLVNRPLMSGTPYDFYSDSKSNGQYVQCPSTTQNVPTSAADTGRLLGALSILEIIAPSYDSTIGTILGRSISTYDEFASTCCTGADYYQYLVGEGFQAFNYAGCSPCSVFSAVNSYSGPYYPTFDGQSLPEIISNAEPLNLEILLGQPHSTSTQFLDFANRVYSVQDYNYTHTGLLTAWTEGDYPPHNYPTAYIYEWVLVLLNGVWQTWQLTGPGFAQEGSPGGPPVGSPVLAFTKTAFSYLAIYGDNAYTDALVNAANQLATSKGFGEATLQNGQSALSLWSQTGDSNAFYSDKTQEQVLLGAVYALTHAPIYGPVQVGNIGSVVSGAMRSAWVVLPDFTAGQPGLMHNSAAKCGGVVAALATDVYAATYLLGAVTNPPQNEILDTNSAYVSQASASCGQPSTSTSAPLVVISGPVVSEVAHYYESTTSPLYYNFGTGCIVRRDTGFSIDCSVTTVPTSDVFLMEAFTDPAGRTVFIAYGRNWPGTLAAYEYLVDFVLKNNPSSYTGSWYVYRWTDAASGPSANFIPDAGDTFTQIAAGP